MGQIWFSPWEWTVVLKAHGCHTTYWLPFLKLTPPLFWVCDRNVTYKCYKLLATFFEHVGGIVLHVFVLGMQVWEVGRYDLAKQTADSPSWTPDTAAAHSRTHGRTAHRTQRYCHRHHISTCHQVCTQSLPSLVTIVSLREAMFLAVSLLLVSPQHIYNWETASSSAEDSNQIFSNGSLAGRRETQCPHESSTG